MEKLLQQLSQQEKQKLISYLVYLALRPQNDAEIMRAEAIIKLVITQDN